jgi:putative ABC transport system permease protein
MMLWLTPWRRAPLLLWHRRPVAMVLAAAACILTAAAASGPLFASSAVDATLAGQLSQGCQQGVALRAGSVDLFGGFASGPDPLAAQMFDLNSTTRLRAVGTLPHVGAPVRELFTEHVHVSLPAAPPGSAGAYVTVMSKTGALDAVDVVDRAGGTRATGSVVGPDAVWLADTTATALRARPGDEVAFGAATGQAQPLRLKVTGIFHDLQKTVAPPFWCDDLALIYAKGNTPRFPFVLVDPATAARLGAALKMNVIDETSWPIARSGLDVDEATRLDQQLDETASTLPDAMRAARNTALAGYLRTHPSTTPDPSIEYRVRESAATRFDLPTHRARFVADVLPSTVLPITAAAICVALLLVGGSASFWFERRRREVDVLLAHGVAPWALGVKAMLEACLPVLLGAVAGWGMSGALVRAVGPSHVISARAERLSLLFAAVATGCGVVCIAIVATLRCRRRERSAVRHRRLFTRVPWDVVVPAAVTAVVALLATAGATVSSAEGGAVARIDPVVLVVPLAGFVAATALVARVVAMTLRRLRRRGQRLPNLAWLAWRRITGLPGAAALLLGAVALPTAIGFYGSIVNASVHRTLDDQNRLLIGADLVVDLPEPTAVPAALRDRAALVVRRDHPSLGDLRVSVVAVDPEQFAKTVFWDDAMPGPSVRTLVAKLRDAGPGKPLAGVLSGDPPTGTTLSFVQGDSDIRVPVDIVATAPHLPGAQGGYQILFVNRTAFERVTTTGTYEFWIRGDPATALQALEVAGVTVKYPHDADSVTDGSYVQPVSYTFSFLDAVVTLAGAVGAGALLLYLDARSRARRVAYVLTRRMGFGRLADLASIALELGAVMLAGLVTGVGLAVIATTLLHSRFSVDPTVPPAAVLGWPLGAVLVDGVVVAAVLAIASVSAHWASERADPAEVLREA